MPALAEKPEAAMVARPLSTEPYLLKTMALDAGQPLQSVQASAGHEDARTTMRYDRNRLALARNVSGVVTDVVFGALDPEA